MGLKAQRWTSHWWVDGGGETRVATLGKESEIKNLEKDGWT